MWYKVKKIYQWTNLVRPVWKPNANTVAYYPLESDGNDYSWNNHNLTWYWTPSYTTSWTTKNVLSLNGSTLWKIANLSGTYTNYTFSVWCKSTSTNSWQEIFDNVVFNTNTNNVYFNFNGTAKELGWYQTFSYQYRPNWWSNSYQNIYESTNRNTGTRYNVITTSTSSGVKLYLNWIQVASNSTTWTIILDSWHNSIGGRLREPTYNIPINFFIGYMSEFIFENKTWTATEVLNYYNQTKSNYWL